VTHQANVVFQEYPYTYFTLKGMFVFYVSKKFYTQSICYAKGLLEHELKLHCATTPWHKLCQIWKILSSWYNLYLTQIQVKTIR